MKTALAMLLVGAIAVAVVSTSRYIELRNSIGELRKECAQKTIIQSAYNDVIYRIWIDKPSYVEDVLSETDEWVVLNDLVDWEDTFEFKSTQDSLTYKSHWSGGEPDDEPVEPSPDTK